MTKTTERTTERKPWQGNTPAELAAKFVRNGNLRDSAQLYVGSVEVIHRPVYSSQAEHQRVDDMMRAIRIELRRLIEDIREGRQ